MKALLLQESFPFLSVFFFFFVHFCHSMKSLFLLESLLEMTRLSSLHPQKAFTLESFTSFPLHVYCFCVLFCLPFGSATRNTEEHHAFLNKNIFQFILEKKEGKVFFFSGDLRTQSSIWKAKNREKHAWKKMETNIFLSLRFPHVFLFLLLFLFSPTDAWFSWISC